MRGHLVEFFVIGDLVQVFNQALQKIKIRGRKLAEEPSDVSQTGFETLNF